MVRRSILLAWLVGSMSLSAQVCVTGRVTDARDGHALEYVHAGVVDGVYKAVGVSTDRAGRYVLCVPAAVSDSIDVRFSFTGYETQWHRIASRQSDTLVLDVSLRIGATTLREVTVTGEARSNNGFTPISTALLDDVAGPGSGVESLVKTLPDVASNNELSSQYSVRGGSFDENLVYVNGVEVFRPMLVRSGQQEGLSLVNPDMVDHLYFSPGGFDARYGDKMSSVLDVNYNRPDRFGMRLSASLLGASARLSGPLGADWGYSVGFRHHSNNYLLGSLDTKGTYRTAYTDLQAVVGGALSEQWSLSLLAIVSRNRYSLVPESQTTTFGSFMESLELNVYFDGEEVDAYSTLLGASTLSWHPSEQTQIDWTVSAQQMVESERYDIQSQYWLYEVGMGGSGDMQRFDRGVGTFLEHARNRLYTQIFTSSLRGTRIVGDGVWLWGLAAQAERVSDRLREWKWVDSAGYAIPAVHGLPGTDTVGPYSPVLQSFSRADNRLSTLRASAYVQREVDWSTAGSYQWRFTAGLRAMSYSTVYQARLADSVERRHVVPLVLSPRVSLGLKPAWEDRDVFFRLALGVYQQAPFYREDRCPDGSLNIPDHPQRSYQAVATFDRKMQLWDKPFKFTADLYYKYITHLVPYSVDNLRVRYDARNDATGYATGISLRLNGELVEGLESWASLSLMHTQEDIRGDGMGWLPRPTDQRLSFKLFLQDNLPALPWWRMSLNFVYGTGVPVVFAHQRDRSQTHRLPAYFRVDWSNSVRLSRFPFYRHSVLRCFSETLVGLEVYNLFNHRNVASYIWVSDYDNIYYPVPNYLTARQLNVRITLEL